MKFFFAVATILAACTTPAILTPAVGPGSDYPCGVGGTVCSHEMCCPPSNTCGGDDPTCPAGSCCFTGDGRLLDGGATTPQRPTR
jgi:hypothetical protein